MSIATWARIALGVVALAIGVRPIEAQPQGVRVPRSVLERYVGEYVHPRGGSINVTLRGDTLYEETASRRTAYVPISETLFRIGHVLTLEFVIDQAGGVTQVATDGADAEYRLRRKGSPPEPPATLPTPSVRVPTAVLERYVGVYEFIPGQMGRDDLRIVVRLDGNRLIRKMQEETVLTPISETRFRVGTTSLTVEFVVDEAGVTQVLGTGFQQLLARLTSKR